MADAQLSPILDYPTDIPAPNVVYDDKGKMSFEVDSTTTVSLKVCSEFANYISPTVPFGGKSKLGLLQSTSGHPILFSIGTDDHLYCLSLVGTTSECWSSFDITPDASKKTITFDVQQTSSKVVLAVALEGTEGSDLYTYVCNAEVFSPSYIQWVSRSAAHIGGSRTIASLSCGGGSSTLHPTIVAGTMEDKTRIATFYTIDTNPSNATPWTTHALADKASVILDVAPGLLPDGLGVGMYTLYTVSGGPVRCVFNKKDAAPVRYMDLEPLGEVRGFFSAVTPFLEGYTDLFVAGSKGIGYFNHIRHQDPQVILPGISFQQVVASEYATKIVVFAISDVGELYYIEGTRGSKIEFLASGYPIRAGIGRLSVQYNVTANSTELIYLDTTTETQIKHLWRDPVSFSWFDKVIAVRPADSSVKKTMSYPAYITSITVSKKSTGESVGPGYPCKLSSDWLHVVVNDRVQMLTAKPVDVKTDAMGRITIVQPANTSLSSPPYQFSLNLFGSATINVHPTQRIVNQMARYSTVEALQNAKTTDGRPVNFSANATQLSDTAEMLGKVGGLVHTVDPEAGEKIAPGGKETTLVGQEANAVDEDWIDSTLGFMADMWEMIKQGLKKVFSITCKIVGTVVRIVVKFAMKTISFVVSTIHSVLKAVSGFLQNTLGITILEDFLDWLGFIFDWENVKKTHTGLVKFVNGTLTSVVDGFSILRPVLISLLDGAKAKLAEVIADHRISAELPEKRSNPLGFLSWIFDNPIVNFLMKYSPINWLMTQVGDIIGDEIKFPDLSLLIDTFRTKLGELLEKDFDVLARLGEDVLEKLKAIVAGANFMETVRGLMGDAIWTCYDLFQNLLIPAFDTIAPFIHAFIDVLNFELKFPIISDLWDTFIDDIPMTLMNVFTLLPAVVMTIFYGTLHKKLPFDEGALGDPMQYVLTKDKVQKSVNSWTRKLSNEQPPFANSTSGPHASSMVSGISLQTVQLQELVELQVVEKSEKNEDYQFLEHEAGITEATGLAANRSQTLFAMPKSARPRRILEKQIGVEKLDGDEEGVDENLVRQCERMQVWGGVLSSASSTFNTAIEVWFCPRVPGDHELTHGSVWHGVATILEFLSFIGSLLETAAAWANPYFHKGLGYIVPVIKTIGVLGQFRSLFVVSVHRKAITNLFAMGIIKSWIGGVAEASVLGFSPKGSVPRFVGDIAEGFAAVSRVAVTIDGKEFPDYYALLSNLGFDAAALVSAVIWCKLVD